MWENLSKYLVNKKILEIGCGIGQKTKHIIRYSNNIIAIDYLNENIEVAKNNLNDNNIKFFTMDASKLEFKDKEFDVVITTDSFHEINPNIQSKVLEEMSRVSDVVIFIEPDENSVTNELFKVFDPNEDHSLRIKNSMDKAFSFMEKNNCKLKEKGEYKDITRFTSRDNMFDTLLNWWSDIKVPKDNEEKNLMNKEIEKILNDFNMLNKLEVFEKINYYVFIKE